MVHKKEVAESVDSSVVSVAGEEDSRSHPLYILWHAATTDVMHSSFESR
jgi:hypothetical protein